MAKTVSIVKCPKCGFDFRSKLVRGKPTKPCPKGCVW